MKKVLLMAAIILALASTTIAAGETVGSAQSLYLQAGKEERSGSPAKAREIYESIIDRFPDSDFAVKANDRLLSLQSPKQQTETLPTASSPLEIFNPAPLKPLPTDPLLRKAVEAVRQKEKAAITAREEYDRLKRVDDARDGRKLTRSRLSDKEKSWENGADVKVMNQFGSSLEELTARAETACREIGIQGKCSEESILKLVTAP